MKLWGKVKKLFCTILVAVVLVLPIPSFSFDQQAGSFKEFEYWANAPGDYQTYEEQPFIDVSTSFTKCTVLGTAEGFYSDTDANGKWISRRGVGVYGQEGSVFYIGNGYWVTNTHVVEPSQVAIQIDKNFTVLTYPIKILSKIITIGQNTGLGSVPAELIYVDEERDICILKTIGTWAAFKDPGYRPEWTHDAFNEELIPGTPIATIVAIRDSDGNKTPWFEVRYGKVINSGVKLPGELPNDLLPWFSLNDVTTDLIIYPGDSGSPVFAFLNGVPVIVGVARAAAGYMDFWTGEIYYYSYFTRIDIAIPFVREGTSN